MWRGLPGILSRKNYCFIGIVALLEALPPAQQNPMVTPAYIVFLIESQLATYLRAM